MKLSSKIAAIELDGDDVRVVVVKTGGAKPAIVEAHAARARYVGPEDRPEALVAAVRDAVGKVKSKPAIYVLAVNCWNAVVRSLAIPFKGAARVRSAVPFELEPFLAFPIDDLIVDHATIREYDGKTEVLAVGVKFAILQEQIESLTAAGVMVEGINLDVAGLTTLWMAGRRNLTGLHVQLHARESGSVLTVTYNKALAFFRPLPLTPERMREDPEVASRQVQNSIRSFITGWKGEHEIADLTVTGVVLDPGQRDTFAEGIDFPVVFENLTDSLKGADKLRAAVSELVEGEPSPLSPCWDAAVGLAASAAGGGVAFEFRQGSLVPANAFRSVLVHGAFSAALLLLVIIGYIGYCFVDYRRNMDEVKRDGDAIWDLYAKSFPDSDTVKQGRLPNDEGGIQTIAAFEKERTAAAEAGSQISSDMLSRPTLLDLLKELSQKLPGDKVTVTDIKVRQNRGQQQLLIVSGEVKDTQAFNQIYEELKQSKLLRFEEEPQLASMVNGKTQFTISANIQGVDRG